MRKHSEPAAKEGAGKGDAYYKGDMHVRDGSSESKPLLERAQLTHQEKLVLVMVGLPARGKSYMSRKIELFFSWKGRRARLFNLGQKRRQVEDQDNKEHASAGFFSANNKEGQKLRDQIALEVVDDMLAWLDEGGGVGILDGTNSNQNRRHAVQKRCEEHDELVRVVFVEVLCDDQEVLEENMRQKVRNSPDFDGQSEEEALHSLRERIANYEQMYETVTDESTSFIKLFNMQSKVHVNKVYGQVARSLLPYVMSLHVHPRPIYLVRAGLADTQMHLDDANPVSSVASLSLLGESFAMKLANFLHSRHDRCVVMSSCWPRALATGRHLKWRCAPNVALNPMDRGVVAKTPPSEFEEEFPEFFAKWSKDRFHTRFPGGESYHDVMCRLEPCVVEIESQVSPVVIISHYDTLQVLYAYFLGVPIDQCDDLNVPKHEVIQLLPTVGGSLNEERFSLFDERGKQAPALCLQSTLSYSLLLTPEKERHDRFLHMAEVAQHATRPRMSRRESMPASMFRGRAKSFGK